MCVFANDLRIKIKVYEFAESNIKQLRMSIRIVKYGLAIKMYDNNSECSAIQPVHQHQSQCWSLKIQKTLILN